MDTDGSAAVALFNSTSAARRVSSTIAATGIGTPGSTRILTDLWSAETTSTTGTISALVPAHGTVVYRVSAAAAGATG